MRRPSVIALAVLVAVAVVVGIAQTGGGEDAPSPAVAPTPAAAQRQLAGSPGPLADLHAQANALLPIEDLDDRLASLRGYPVVINIWGSWCNPCREEFPILQRLSASEGRRVAFIGIATQDAEENAGAFLRRRPVSYPSYLDFDGRAADRYGAIGAPATIFLDENGRRAYFHQGKYRTDEDLRADIRRYLGA